MRQHFAARNFPRGKGGRGRGALWLVLMLAPLLWSAGCASTPKVPDQWQAGVTARSVARNGTRDEQPRVMNLPFETLLEKGAASLAEDNLRVAEFYFSAASAKDPSSEDALVGLGQTLARQKLNGKADAAFRKVLELNPDSVPALLGLGRVCGSQGRHEEALGYFLGAAEKNPENLTVIGALASAYEAAGQESAAEPLLRLVAEKTGTVRAYNNLGFNVLTQKRYGEAATLLERAVQIDPADVRARNNLAVAYAMSGREDKAFQLFEATLGKAAAYNNLGYLQMIQGNWAQAEASFQNAIEANPSYYVKARENLDRLGQMLYDKSKEDLDRLRAAQTVGPLE